MSPPALAVTLAAALVHALWNQLLARTDGTHARTATAMLVGSVVFLPVALADFRLDRQVWGLAAVSVVFELAYFATLSSAYARAPMGVVYPVARGSAPVFVLLVGLVVLRQRPSVLGVLGVVLVVTGILLVRGVQGGVSARHLALAVTIGACIAGYTLIDARAVAHASPAAYLEVVLLSVAVVYAAAVVRQQGLPALRSALSWQTALAGVGIFVAYGLVLVALTLAPAAPVAATRETSVVIAVLLLALTRQERITVPRALGAAVVCAGIGCLVLG